MPTIQLPTVSTENDFGAKNMLKVHRLSEDVEPNSISSKLENNEYPDYDGTKSYGIIYWTRSMSTTSGRTEFKIVSDSEDKICAMNITDETLSFYAARVAVCSSNEATVEKVEAVNPDGSAGDAFNAFKYRVETPLGIIDYWYVLDEVQTDWVTDLRNIDMRPVLPPRPCPPPPGPCPPPGPRPLPPMPDIWIPTNLREKYIVERVQLYNLLAKIDEGILALSSGSVASYSLGNRSVSYQNLDALRALKRDTENRIDELEAYLRGASIRNVSVSTFLDPSLIIPKFW